MKIFTKLFLALLFAMSCSTMMAQKVLSPAKMKAPMVSMLMDNKSFTGFEPAAQFTNPNLPVLDRTEEETLIGRTVYDLQTNSTVQRRLVKTVGGKMAATWTMGFEEGAYADRGTGYNAFDGSAWGGLPMDRLETERTGWPTVGATSEGHVVIVSHTSNNQLKVLRNESGAWEESYVPSSTPNGMLWPRTAVGGANGKTVHCLAITTPVANGGTAYQDVDGHILYHRSLDGGATWDKVDVTITGLDSDFYSRMDADAYTIQSRDDIVAIGLFSDLGDVAIVKSFDNGETWEKTIVKDFPIDQYVIDQGWTIDDITFDPEGPDSLAIQSSDNTGALIIDPEGLVHVWYGEMYYIDDVLTDANFSFFPLWSGIRYWNESFGEDASVRLIEGLVDANGNDTIDIGAAAEIGRYFTSTTSFPTAGVDSRGYLYLAYSAVTEEFYYETMDHPKQFYRHIYLTASPDGGETWTDLYDLINSDVVLEPEFAEAVFPSADPDVDSKFHLTYQADLVPGLALRGDMDPVSDNFINYVGVDIEDLGIDPNSVNVVTPETFDMTITPNPADATARVAFTLLQSSDVVVKITNLVGQELRSNKFENVGQGEKSLPLNVRDLAPGVYVVRMLVDNQVASSKMVVR